MERIMLLMTGRCIKYLCSLLNVKLIRLFLQQNVPTSGTDTKRWKKAYVETIPIPNISNFDQLPLIRLVNNILLDKMTDPNSDTSNLEIEIDDLAYQLYGLTSDEIAVVEAKT